MRSGVGELWNDRLLERNVQLVKEDVISADPGDLQPAT
jgi:hypothetical protein